MPRPRQNDRPVKKKLSIRQSLINEVDLALRDPLTNRPGYGDWSTLVESLLNEWLEGNVTIGIKPAPRVPLDEFL